MFAFLLGFSRAAARRYFLVSPVPRMLTVLISFLVLGGVAVGLYHAFGVGLRALRADVYFAEGVLLYSEELFLLVIFGLIFVSALIGGLTQLYRSRPDDLLVASPSYVRVPQLLLFRVLFLSLWPFILVLVPFLIAGYRVLGISLGGLLVEMFAGLLLVGIAVLLALAILLAINHVLVAVHQRYPRVRPSLMRSLVLLVPLALAAVVSLWYRFQGQSFQTLFRPEDIDAEAASMDAVFSLFSGLPSHLVASTFYAVEHGIHNAEYVGLLALLLVALVLLYFYRVLASRHLPLWQLLREGRVGGVSRFSFGDRWMSHASSQLGVLMRAEALRFFRDARGLLWFGSIFALWVFQIGANALLVHRLGATLPDPAELPRILSGLRLLTVIYFSALFALRFAFPLHAIDRKARYLVASTPVSFASAYLGKFLFVSMAFTGLTLFFALWNSMVIPLAGGLCWYLLTVVVSSVTLLAIALLLGLSFRDSSIDDPELLATTGSGMAFVGIVVLYGGAMAWALDQHIQGSVLPLVVCLGASIVLTGLTVVYPMRRLDW